MWGLKAVNRKAYLITPIIFIVLFLIAILFALYSSKIDADIAQGIRISASVEKGITDIYKMQIEQTNFAKLSVYNCSKAFCYNESASNWNLKNCINNSLNSQYGNQSWNIALTNSSVSFNTSSFNITNINMESDRIYTKTKLYAGFFNKC